MELFCALNDVLNSDPTIDEFGIVVQLTDAMFEGPAGSESGDHGGTSSKPAPQFVCRNRKLGVISDCVPELYRLAEGIIIKRLPTLRTGLLSQIDSESVDALTNATRIVLLINADSNRAWNIRKSLLESGLLSLTYEVRLLDLVFSKHPKSAEGWSHRRWVLSKLLKIQANPHDVLQHEISVCSRCADIYPKNYHAWLHRQWIARNFDLVSLEEELKRCTEWNVMHISDYSGFHHRQFVLRRLLQCRAEKGLSDSEQSTSVALLEDEFISISDLITMYPGHEALWCHRRGVWCLFLLDIDARRRSVDEGGESQLVWSGAFFKKLRQESRFASRCAKDRDVRKYEAQKRFATRYKLFLELSAVRTFPGNADEIRKVLKHHKKGS